MSHRWKPIVACLSLFVFAVAGGCGRGGDNSQSPTAAIGEPPSGDGSKTPASSKSTADSEHPIVVIETSLGRITVELDHQKAKLTVDNFLLYVNASFYDQSIIHQVFKGQGILAGGYGTNMLPIPKPTHAAVRNEADNKLKNLRGTISMVRQLDSIHSATSQFFINVADNTDLDYKDRNTPEGYGYCVFGKVTDGMDVVDKINDAAVCDKPPLERTPSELITVKSIRRIR